SITSPPRGKRPEQAGSLLYQRLQGRHSRVDRYRRRVLDERLVGPNGKNNRHVLAVLLDADGYPLGKAQQAAEMSAGVSGAHGRHVSQLRFLQRSHRPELETEKGPE